MLRRAIQNEAVDYEQILPVLGSAKSLARKLRGDRVALVVSFHHVAVDDLSEVNPGLVAAVLAHFHVAVHDLYEDFPLPVGVFCSAFQS